MTTAQIASAFLVPEATMGQRISRAKQAIKVSGMRFHVPLPGEWTTRRTTSLPERRYLEAKAARLMGH